MSSKQRDNNDSIYSAIYSIYDTANRFSNINWMYNQYHSWNSLKILDSYKWSNSILSNFNIPPYNLWTNSLTNAMHTTTYFEHYSNLLGIISANSTFNVSDNTLSSWIDDIYRNIDWNTYPTFAQNLENVMTQINDEDIKIDNTEIEEKLKSDEGQKKSKSLIQKVLRGTLTDEDYKNNPFAIYMIRVIFWILATFGACLLGDFYQFVKESIKTNYYLQQEPPDQINYQNYRYITADVLNVRKQPSTEAEIMGTLKSLNIVQIIDEVPYWYKIEYIDLINDISIKGWIAKRYTERFPDEINEMMNVNVQENIPSTKNNVSS